MAAYTRSSSSEKLVWTFEGIVMWIWKSLNIDYFSLNVCHLSEYFYKRFFRETNLSWKENHLEKGKRERERERKNQVNLSQVVFDRPHWFLFPLPPLSRDPCGHEREKRRKIPFLKPSKFSTQMVIIIFLRSRNKNALVSHRWTDAKVADHEMSHHHYEKP